MTEPTPAEVDAYQDAQVAAQDTELWHWKYRVIALTRQVEYIHDTVNMASARRAPKNADELAELQVELDTAVYLLFEAKHKVYVMTGIVP